MKIKAEENRGMIKKLLLKRGEKFRNRGCCGISEGELLISSESPIVIQEALCFSPCQNLQVSSSALNDSMNLLQKLACLPVNPSLKHDIFQRQFITVSTTFQQIFAI
jgi:hypothetical protein